MIIPETVEEAKDLQCAIFSQLCQYQIVAGIDYENGHYTYNLEDQADIKTLAQAAKDTQLSVPYHPSGGQTCRLYTPQEIAGLYAIAQTHLRHHLTYSNQLKLYVKSLTTIEDIMKVSYGQELTGEFLNTYNMIMEQANKVIQKFIGIETGGATQ